MSSFSVSLDEKRTWRYVFEANLWERPKNKYGLPVNVLLDTGSFNTIVHEALVKKYGVLLPQTMTTSVGGYKGESPLCVLHKFKIGNFVMEKVIALAVPFEGELKDHILLGANVTNNWHFAISRYDNRLDITEKLSKESLDRKYPYCYCFNNRGQIIALQEFELSEIKS